MKICGLISGGKDSCFNLMKCVENGHQIICLANLYPADGRDEIDSYMYQTVGHDALQLYSDAIGVPLYRKEIIGKPVLLDKSYLPTEHDEVEDLYDLLKTVKEKHDIEGVAVGAIFSEYQGVRVQNVCDRLNLSMLAYLWQSDQEILMKEMIEAKLYAIIIKVAAMGLQPELHLGLNLEQIYPVMISLKDKYGLNVCGEGGEFESFVLDCPLFNKKIVVDETEMVIHSNDAFAPVGYLKFKKMHLENKTI